MKLNLRCKFLFSICFRFPDTESYDLVVILFGKVFELIDKLKYDTNKKEVQKGLYVFYLLNQTKKV